MLEPSGEMNQTCKQAVWFSASYMFLSKLDPFHHEPGVRCLQ